MSGVDDEAEGLIFNAVQTDVKLCLIDHFSFNAKALVKPGDMVI